MTCSTCSLWRKCSLYREGSVCTVGRTQGRKLVQQFQTRNAASVAEGLRHLVELQAGIVDDEYREYSEYVEPEDADKAEITGDPEDAVPGPDPVEVERRRASLMRNMNSLFANGSKLYALDRPAGPAVQVNVGMQGVGAASVAVNPATDQPRTLAAKAVAELEAKGIEPTDDAIQAIVAGYAREHEPEVIEGEWS